MCVCARGGPDLCDCAFDVITSVRHDGQDGGWVEEAVNQVDDAVKHSVVG